MKNKKKKELLYNTVSDIDADYVADFINYDNKLSAKEKKTGTYHPVLRILGAFAVCAVIFGGMFAGLKYLEYRAGAAINPQAASAPDKTKTPTEGKEAFLPDKTEALTEEKEVHLPDETEALTEEKEAHLPDETEALTEEREESLPVETETTTEEKEPVFFRLAKKTQTVPGATYVTVYEYDELGRVIKETQTSQNGAGTKIEYTYTYDDAGNTVKTYFEYISYYERTVTEDEREYSAEGRLVSKYVKSTNYDAASVCGTSKFSEKYEYDENGRIVRMEQNNKVYKYEYTDEYGSYILEGAGTKTTVTFNEKGLITTVSEIYNGKERITQNEYDEHGNLTKTFVDGRLISECSFTYDNDVVIMEDFTSVTTGRRCLTYEFDEYKNVKGYTVCSDDGTVIETMTYEWEIIDPVSAE